ncbi:MAG: hypothetical protein ACK5MV_07670 [Aminipila sp.]
MNNYKVYIKTSNDLVTEISSSAFLSDVTDYVLIDEGLGDKYYHAQGNYLDKPLFDMQGCHNYKYVGGKMVETTAEEKQVELGYFPKPEPTEQEKSANYMLDLDYRLSLQELGGK